MFVARIIRSAKKYVVGKVESFDWVFSKGLIDQLRDWRPGASSRYADTTRLSHRSSMWVTFPQMSIQMLQPNVRMFALPRHVMNRRPFNRTMLHCHNTHGLPFLRDGSKVRNRQRTRRTSISSAPTSSPYKMRWNCHTVNLIFMQYFFFSVLLLLSLCWVEMFYDAVSWMRKVSGLTFGRGISCIHNLYIVFFSSARQMPG